MVGQKKIQNRDNKEMPKSYPLSPTPIYFGPYTGHVLAIITT